MNRDKGYFMDMMNNVLHDRLSPDLSQLHWTPQCSGVSASPSWQACSYRIFTASASFDNRLRLKIPYPHTVEYAAPDNASTFAQRLDHAGLGPEVLWAENDVIVTRQLSELWRPATVSRLSDPHLFEAMISLHKSTWGLPASGLNQINLFEDLRQLWSVACRSEMQLPEELAELVHLALSFAAVLNVERERVPAHGDGTANNVMIHSGSGRLMLVGGSCSGLMDPYLHIGTLVAEYVPLSCETRQIVELMLGNADAGSIARSHLYAIAWDIKWALLCRVVSHRWPDVIPDLTTHAVLRTRRAQYFVATLSPLQRVLDDVS